MDLKHLTGPALRLLARISGLHLAPVRGMAPDELGRRLPQTLGLYVHVPFCETLCRFCPYNRVRYQPNLVQRYRDALRRELELVRPLLRGRQITSLYIGGGTPTLLMDDLEWLCQQAAEFGVAGEIGVEVLPGHATEERLDRLRQAGVTFVSVGVQSFDDVVLGRLGRSHDAATARTAVERCLAAGFRCVDVDLIFDPVSFGTSGALQDAEAVFELGAHQLSAYPMMRFGYTPLGQSKVHDEHTEKCILDAMDLAGRARGYQRSSVWTFNKDAGTRYTSITRQFFLGLGPSGSTFLDGLFSINTFDTAAYAELVQEGLLPVALRSDLDRRSSMGYWLFWRMYEGSLDRRRFASLFGRSLERSFPLLLGFLLATGGMRRSGDVYELTRSGFDMYHTLERWVTYQLIEPTWAACRSTPFPRHLVL